MASDDLQTVCLACRKTLGHDWYREGKFEYLKVGDGQPRMYKQQ